MAKKAIPVDGVEPTTTPTRRRKAEDTDPKPQPVEAPEAIVEAVVEAPAVEPTPQPKPKPEKAEKKPPKGKSKEGKAPEDRHPITATIPMAQREGLIAFAGAVTSDEKINPKAVRVTLGTVASMFAEHAAAIAEGDEASLAKLRDALNAEDPKEAIAKLAVEYKQSQRAS